MSAYREFTGKTVEEALRNAREAFGAGLDDLDFEILTPGSRGVLGMGAEPARIVAAPRSALGGATPKREAAAATPLPVRPPRDERPRDDRGPRRDGGRREDRGPRREERPREERPREERPREERPSDERPREERPARREERPDRGRRPGGERPPRREDRAPAGLNAEEAAQVAAARGSVASERADLEAAEASPEALAAGREILEELMKHLGFEVKIEIETGDTSRLNVVGGEDGHEALGALIGRKGERLSALQHLVN